MERTHSNLEAEIKGLGMFVGEFSHNLDPKRRLTIPSVWRAQVGEPLLAETAAALGREAAQGRDRVGG